MQTRVLIKRNIEFSSCHNCRAVSTLRKSKARNSFDKLSKILFFRTYNCQNCGWRGKVFKYKLANKGLRALFLYLMVFGLVAYLTLFAIRKYFIIEPEIDIPIEIQIE